MRKINNNGNLWITKKSHITHFFVTICFIVYCSCWPSKSFFAILSFAKMAKNRFVPLDHVAPPSPTDTGSVIQCSLFSNTEGSRRGHGQNFENI